MPQSEARLAKNSHPLLSQVFLGIGQILPNRHRRFIDTVLTAGHPRGCVHQRLDAQDSFLLKIGEGKNHDRVLTTK